MSLPHSLSMLQFFVLVAIALGTIAVFDHMRVTQTEFEADMKEAGDFVLTSPPRDLQIRQRSLSSPARILAALHSPDARIRYGALEYIRYGKIVSAVPELEDILSRNGDPEFQKYATYALIELAPAETAKSVIGYAMSLPDEEFSLYGLTYLLTLGEKAVPYLLDWPEHGDTAVQRRLRALEILTGSESVSTESKNRIKEKLDALRKESEQR